MFEGYKGYKKVNGLKLAQMTVALEREVRTANTLEGKTAVLEALIVAYDHLKQSTFMIKEDELDKIKAFVTRL